MNTQDQQESSIGSFVLGVLMTLIVIRIFG